MLYNLNGIKLKTINRKIPEKSSNIWRLDNTFLKNPWVKEGSKREIRKYSELNKNENIIYQNVWGAAKAVLRGNFIALNAYIREDKSFRINDLCFYLKKTKLEKEKQINPELSGRKKIASEQQINKRENKQ